MEDGRPADQSVARLSLKTMCPALRDAPFDLTSERTPNYNCYALAVGDFDICWDPTMGAGCGYYWPPGAPQEETVTAFVEAFARRGFAVCENGTLEGGVEKIALYVKDDIPMHAAVQLPGGRWKSKLGDLEDIEHESPGCLEGDYYGQVQVYLARSRSP